MKTNSRNPFHPHAAEEPIIRPLEQRRVPSATGAAFALPLPPEAADDAHVEEVPADFEGEITVEGEVSDEFFVIDPLPINFDDVIDGIGAGKGEYVMDEGTIEEFNPDVIFYTLFAGGVDENGEPIPFAGEVFGCGGIGDGLPLEGEILGGEEGIGDGEVIEEVPAFLDKDGDGLDDVTGESYQPPVYWTVDMIKRGDGATTGTGDGEEINPEIYYSAAGGPGPTAGEAPDTAAGDHSPAPEHHAAADHTPEVVATQPDSSEIALEVESATTSFVLPASSGHEIIHFDDLNVPVTPVADLGAISYDSVAHDLEITPVAFGSNSADAQSSGFEAAHSEVTVDAWVPSAGASAELVAHFDGLTGEAQHEHAEVIAPVDAGATAIHGDAMRGSSAALAATGAVLLSRDAKKREEKEQA